MLSFGKILMLAAVVLVVMVVWRWLKARDIADASGKPRRTRAKRESIAQDMEPCPSCGTYIATGTGSCGRPECPATGSRP